MHLTLDHRILLPTPFGIGGGKDRMGKAAFGAAGDDPRAAIAGANSGQRDQDIDLPTLPTSINLAILVADRPFMAAAMHRKDPTRPTDRCETFVDEQPLDSGLILAAIAPHPGGHAGWSIKSSKGLPA